MADRILEAVSARYETSGPNGDTRTGRIKLYGRPTWLKGNPPLVHASLTTLEARRLAMHLLVACDAAERAPGS